MEQCGNITIIESESRFKKVDKSLIENPNIDCLTLGIYTKLIVLGKKWKLNVKGLRNHLGLSDEKVRKSLSLLEKEGYILRTPTRNEKGQMMGWNYAIYPTPINESERSQAGFKNENRQDEEPTPRKTDHSDIGGHLNNRLNQQLDLIEFKEQKIERNQKKYNDELFNQFEEFANEYKTLCGKHTVSGIKTLYEDFKKRHKDWRDIIPLLLPALKMEHQARTNANARNEFYPSPKNLSTYLGKQRAWEVWLDDIVKYNEKEYRPICDGISLFWNELQQCYITPFDIDGIADGYTNANRPNGAVVMWCGYKYMWNSEVKNWIKQG